MQADLKSVDLWSWGFKSPRAHHFHLRDAARQPIARVPVRGFSSNLHQITPTLVIRGEYKSLAI